MIILFNPRSTKPRNRRLPLSVLALGAVLEGREEYEIVDGNLDENPTATILGLIDQHDVEMLGVTVMPGPQMAAAVETCLEIRRLHPKLTIVWGGYFPSIYTDATLNARYVDYVVRGQGEDTLLELLDAMRGKRKLESIQGLSYKDVFGLHRHNPERLMKGPDAFPWTPFHKVPVEKYMRPSFFGERTAVHHASIGCPFRCSFCGIHAAYGNRERMENPSRTEAILRHLKSQYGADSVQFYDMNFFLREDHARDLADRIAPLNLQWWCEARVDIINKYSDATLAAIRRAGCTMIFFGAESGSDWVLKEMEKDITTEETLNVARRIRQFDIIPEFSFVIGNPRDPERDTRETLQFIRTIKRLNPKSEIIMYHYTPVPQRTAMYGNIDGKIAFPTTPEEWATKRWMDFTLRIDPNTPWLTRKTKKLIDNFEVVVSSRWPTVQDIRAPRWSRALLNEDLHISRGTPLGAPIHQSAQTEGGKPVIAESPEAAPSLMLPGASLSAQDVYRWASRSYDTEPNALLALECRFLETLLPVMTRLDVIDLGCGTGRWLAALASRSPRKLVGVDLSQGMLQVAKCKIDAAANLVLADCTALPFPRASADLVLGSFLASYLPDVAIFAEQVRRILRPGGTVFLTDLHPTTAAKLGWRRGFRVGGTFLDVPTYVHSIREILRAFQELGLEVAAVIEPHFGEPEMDVFHRAGKADAFHTASGGPAIFIVQLSLKSLRQRTSTIISASRMVRQFVGARVALGTCETVCADIRIDSGKIQFLGHRPNSAVDRAAREHSVRTIDLSGYLLLPGLINAHDHLEFALFPRLGKGGYRNFVEWADDIHRPGASPVREHRAVPKNTRLWWGGIRNLLAGVTTVCHHNPYVAEVFDRGFAVRVLRDFRWAHSLQMGQQALARLENRKCDQPFIIHLAEGVGPQSADEIFRLSDQHTLDDRTVIVHGLGLDAKGRAFLNSAGASLVWCPTSNAFLFGRTHDRETVSSFAKVALGSDSSLTADGDLLDEIRFAHEAIGMLGKDLYAFVTTRAAEVLRLHSAEGTIRIGGVADFVGVRDTGLSPAQTLTGLSFRNVELVVIGGYIHLASPDIYDRLPRLMRAGLHRLEVDTPLAVGGASVANPTIRWIRAPLTRLIADARAHLSGDIYLDRKRIRHAGSA